MTLLRFPIRPSFSESREKLCGTTRPEHTLERLATFLANLMVYGSAEDVAVTTKIRTHRRVSKSA